MNAPAAAHPSLESLTAYGLGKADEETIETVHRHLETCEACRRIVEGLSADGLVAGLRAANNLGATPTPDKSLGGLKRTTFRPPDSNGGLATGSSVPEANDQQKYEIVRELGGGGMDVVYLVRNIELNRHEALKVMRENLVVAPAAVERFRQEILASSVLEHDNIVRVYAFVRTNDQIGFTMQFEDGKDLDQLVKQGKPLPVSKASYYAHQVAQGLQFAHQKGVVHRDIKPSNMILVVTGKKHRVKILDFGLAKAASDDRVALGLTQAGATMGTPAYMAPEQALNSATADIRADIYSLGCSLYFLLAGRTPFGGKTAMEILIAHREDEAERLDRLRADVPPGLADLVAKMIAKNPDQRFQTPAEVAEALIPFFRTVARPTGAESASGTEPDDKSGMKFEGPATVPSEPELGGADFRKPDPQRRRIWPLAAVALSAVVLGLLVAWAGGVFKLKTKDGTIVLENVPQDAEVMVDGEKVTITRNGETATVAVNREGAHKLQVVVGGKEVYSSDLTVKIGGEPVRLRVESPAERKSGPRPRAEDRPHATGIVEPRADPTPKLDDGFVALFNGKDLTDWERTNPNEGGAWKIRDGILYGSGGGQGRPTTLATKKHDFRDFHLRVRLLHDQGMTLLNIRHAFDKSDDNAALGYRIVIGHPAGPREPAVSRGSIKRMLGGDPKGGNNFDAVAIATRVAHDEWFTLEVVAKDSVIRSVINGKEVAEYRDKLPPSQSGRISIFCRGDGGVQIKSIEIKELPATKK
jgi:serine/threonine protein kinase